MAKQVTCNLCGEVIKDGQPAFKVYPARCDGGELVGTVVIDDEARQSEPIGEPFDVCRKDLKKLPHALEEKE